MQNFLRLIRPALNYRWTIGGIFFSSVMVALLWGLNIGTLYPVLEVAFERQPLQDSIADKIARAEKETVELEAELASSTPAQRKRLQVRIDRARDDIRLYSYVVPITEWLPRDPFKTILVIVGLLITGTILKGLFVFMNFMLVSRLERRITFDLRQQFFHKCLKLTQSTFGEQRSSSLLSRFHADVGCLAAAIRAISGTALREPLKMLACLAAAAWISPRLLLLSLILTPITAVTVRRLAGSIKRANRRSLEELSTLFGVLTEAFQGIETIQAFTLERCQRQRFFGVAKACLHKSMRIALYNSLTKPITELLGICVIALALVSGAYLTLNEAVYIGPIRMLDRPLDLSSMLLFFSFLIGATEPARKLSDVFNAIQAGAAAADRLTPILDREPKIQDPAVPQELPAGLNSIRFEQVSFAYRDAQVLIDIKLEIHGGETIAIVGPNGCGKTTLINMLPRFHDPNSGSVTINGIDIRNVRLRDLRNRIGLVTQRSILFDDTVYNNIRHGRLSAARTDIIRAAKAARADRFILDKLEHGYDTIIGTAGGKLSGGQRQRLALARAMVREPELLILDEATSQIDLESEQLIHQALEQFCRDRTVIMVTHRLSTLELADRIVVMDHGKIEDVGTDEELMGRCALYQRLHELQFKRSA